MLYVISLLNKALPLRRQRTECVAVKGDCRLCLVFKADLDHETPVFWVSESSTSCSIDSASVSCAAAAAETSCVGSSVDVGAGAAAGTWASLSAFGRSGAFLISRTSPASGVSWPSS